MLKNTALVIASLLFGLVLIEAFLRLLGWSFPIFAQPDPDLGWSFRPRLQGWATHENTAYVRINRQGFRGEDWPQHARGFRIAVLGDSFVESSNLPDEQALTTLIQRNLQECPTFRPGLEVLNLGVSGYGTGQEYVLLTKTVQLLHPNMVVLAFYAGNDVANNARVLSAAGQTEKPYFHELADGALNLDTSFRTTGSFQKSVAQDWRKRAMNSSYLLQVVKQAVLGKPIMPDPKPLDAVHIEDLQEQPMFAPEYVELFSAPPDATWADAWSVTEKVLVSMRDWTQAQHMHFGLIIIPPPVAVLPTQEMRQKAIAKFGLNDLQYPVERIARFAAEAGISFLDLREALRNAGDSERIYLYGFAPRYGDGHLNATGNAVSGKAIARWLCERPPLQQ